MVRRGQQRQREEARAARVREASLADEHGEYVPPPRSMCDQSPLRRFAGFQSDQLQYQATVWRQAGRIVDFQITLRLLGRDGGHWIDAIEIDCGHGHVHWHESTETTRHGPAKHLYRLDTVKDVQDGLSAAIEFIADVSVGILAGREGPDERA